VRREAMSKRLLNTEFTPTDKLEGLMRKVSLRLSLVALGLMVGGLIATLHSGISLTVDTAAIPVFAFRHIAQAPRGLVVMSAGIVLLALLPSVRVALAMYLYIRHRKGVEALVAMVVLFELLLSMWLEG
jgi:hypothetical protein